ncbi:YTH domain-containing family protein 2-like isoform X4 [Prunus yedoensis var. nudiflora]|uniref:YTH domain-containing family protein n=1 Tax=Prunus yedoensis var. nudiflora TaxID=2094558 RepID=A0A314U7J5_PRUYE|nr:YTH domain-containing family protein 2-like isoform X4 [Prunus yedoensis var. nudiflora]
MATVSPPVDQAADLLQNLSLDSQTKGPDDIPDPAKKPNIVTAKSKSYIRSKTPLRQDFMDPAMCYIPNGYTFLPIIMEVTSYGGTGNEWGGISSYVNPNGSDMNSVLHHMRLGYGMDTANGLVNGLYTNGLYGHYWNPNRLGMGYGSNGFGMQRNGCGWMAFQNKYKSRGRGSSFRYGNQDIEGLDELNKGPRGKSYKNQKGYSPVTVAVKGCNMPLNKTDDEKDALSMIPECEQYIGADIHDHYADAKFFIIKSYSEDDVHKSVKYNVWASTPNGNNKLNAAYQEAQEKSGGCPVFLFFSVNTSGQFVGLAEMVGMVDFDKSVEYWQQAKWTGCFPVKWHIVKSEQGLKMIKIFKDHSSKTCLLDDFEFYEARQKTIQENKAKQQIRKQVLDGKPTNGRNYRTDESLKSPESFGTALDLIKEPTSIAQTDEELKLSENGSVAETGDGPKGPEAVVSEVTVTE